MRGRAGRKSPYLVAVMAEKLNRGEAQEHPDAAVSRLEAEDPGNARSESQPPNSSAPVGDSTAEEPSNLARGCGSSDASLEGSAKEARSPIGAPETDCQETSLRQDAPADGSSGLDCAEERKEGETAPGRNRDGAQDTVPEAVIDDRLTSTGCTAMENLVDAFALASHDDFLTRGDDPHRWNPDCEPYEPWPTFDLVRRDGSIKIAMVQWKRGIPTLTSYTPPVTYQGRVYDVPSLPPTMYEWMSLPTDVRENPSARQVFDAIYSLLQGGAILSDQQCELLTFWVIATWFADVLDVVPRLTVTGSRFAAALLFQLLRVVCHRAILLAGIKPAVLKQIPFEDLQPTLLIHETRPGKGAMELLNASDFPGYFVACGGELRQFCCARCVYVGEEADPGLVGQGLHLHLGRNAALPARPYASRESAAYLQNLLLGYRCYNLGRRGGLSSSPNEYEPTLAAAARRLGAVIFEDSELQERVAETLREQNEQMRGDRASGLYGLVLQAVLVLAHRDEQQVYARDIAAAANQICVEHGESLKLSAEKVGHALKRLGLYTRGLSNRGRGLILDNKTQIRAHQLSREYDVLPVVPECAYCHNLQTTQSEELE